MQIVSDRWDKWPVAREVERATGTSEWIVLEFRAVWFTYYWVFFDAEFDRFTTFYPDADDCALFVDKFCGRYGDIAPVPVFDELCTDRWNPDGSERN